MKNKPFHYFIAIMLIFGLGNSYAQINMPMASPHGTVSTTVGLTEVSVDYYRPSLKGRQIFGEGRDYLQPFGQIWRTGANNGTVLSLSTDATIAGKEVKAGDYLVFTIPGASEWKFMLYKDLSIGGNTAAYKKENEALEVSVAPIKLPMSVETLTIQVANIKADNTGADLHIMWENTAISIPISVDFHDEVMNDIAAKTKVSPNNYIAAANYYLNTGQDLEQAYEWAKMGTQDGQFWNIHLQAKILAEMGKKDEAIKTAQKSMEVAKASGNDFGYVKLNEDLIAGLK